MNLVSDIFELADGEEAKNPTTKQKVKRYQGRVYYVVSNDGGGSASKLDVSRPVDGLIGDYRLPNTWTRIPRKGALPGVSEDLLMTY